MSLKKNTQRRKQFGIILNSIDELVPKNHMVRKYEAAIDWSFIYGIVEGLYSKKGTTAVDPVVLFKMVMLNYLEGINSMRKLCEKAQTDIAYRWFLGIDFNEKIPDHSTYSQNYARKYAGSKVSEKIFEEILNQLYEKGMIQAKVIYGDATHVKANANKKKAKDVVIKEISKSYQEELVKEINEDRIRHGKKELIIEENVEINENEEEELLKNEGSEEIIEIEKNEEGKIVKYKTHDAETGEVHIRNNKKCIRIKESKTDPESGYYHKGEHEKIFAYSVSSFCDKNGYILAAFVDAGNKHDSVTFFDLYQSLRKTPFINEIQTVCLDAGYLTPAIVRKLIIEQKTPLLPYVRPKTKDGYFKKYEYVYDEKYDCYICPNNEILEYTTTNKLGYKEYKSNKEKCKNCPYLSKCTSNKKYEKTIFRHVWEEYLEQAHDIRHTLGMKEIYNQRKQTIERCFADGKEKHGLRFTRYTGKERVRDSILLTFACMNLKKMARRMTINSSDFFQFYFFLTFLDFLSSLFYLKSQN